MIQPNLRNSLLRRATTQFEQDRMSVLFFVCVHVVLCRCVGCVVLVVRVVRIIEDNGVSVQARS